VRAAITRLLATEFTGSPGSSSQGSFGSGPGSDRGPSPSASDGKLDDDADDAAVHWELDMSHINEVPARVARQGHTREEQQPIAASRTDESTPLSEYMEFGANGVYTPIVPFCPDSPQSPGKSSPYSSVSSSPTSATSEDMRYHMPVRIDSALPVLVPSMPYVPA
jgi:hypothetical protein